jgi:valyl-tRNA synthetase
MNLSPANRALGSQAPRLNGDDLGFAERWIRSRLAITIDEARKAIEAYRFNDYANVLYQFTWHEFCDWYIEMSKLSLNGTIGSAPEKSQRLLLEILDRILLLLHPIMPFVTEEIWQHLRGDEKAMSTSAGDSVTIMTQRYPDFIPDWVDSDAEQKMDFLMGIIRAIRNLRTEMNCPPGKEVKVVLHGPEQNLSFVRAQELYLRSLARVGAIDYMTSGERPKGAATAVVGSTEIYLPLGDMINLQEEQARLTKEVRKVEEELARIHKKLANNEFLSKAKEQVVQKEREKASQYEEKRRTLNLSLERIQEIQAGRNE